VERASASGLNAVLVTTAMEGEAREVGSMIAGMIRSVDRLGRPVGRPACLVFAGETTVTVRGGGTGGRNQELALSAAIGMRGIGGACVAAFSTDGQDGPTLAAGAIATGETAARAAALGMDPLAYLDDNDSNTFFSRLEDLMRTGPTLTNVADLVVALIL
jgi:hydroxypyruvate reductase